MLLVKKRDSCLNEIRHGTIETFHVTVTRSNVIVIHHIILITIQIFLKPLNKKNKTYWNHFNHTFCLKTNVCIASQRGQIFFFVKTIE